MNCPKCNKPIVGNFCTECGYKNPFQKMDNSPSYEAKQPISTPAYIPPQKTQTPPIQPPAAYTNFEGRTISPESNPDKKRFGATGWILIGIALLLTIGIVLLMILLLGDGVKDQKTDKVIPGETKLQEQYTPTNKPEKAKDYIGTWLSDYYCQDAGWIEIKENTIIVNWEGDGACTYSYTEIDDTKIRFVDDCNTWYTITYINPDLLGIYIEDDNYYEGYYGYTCGEIDESVFLFREGAETTNITLPDSYYLYFNDIEQKYVYYPNANMICVCDVGDTESGYVPLYIKEDGSLEDVSYIALYGAEDIPSCAIYTDDNFIVIPSRAWDEDGWGDDEYKEFIGSWRIYGDSNRNKTTNEAEAQYVWDITLEENGEAVVAAGYYLSEYSHWYEGTWTQDPSDPYYLTLNLTGGSLWFDETGIYTSDAYYTIKIRVTVGDNMLALNSADNAEDITLRLNEWYEQR